MSANENPNVESHKIEANDNLVKSVIVDQTDNLEKGWREGFQNVVDSMASEGRLKYNHNYTLITDNGQGVPLTEEVGIDLLTVMGESSKDSDDHDTVGEFGVGLGQMIAKGSTVFISGDTALMFDIKGWGLEAKTVPLSEAASVAAQYDDEWGNLIDKHFGSFDSYDGLAVLVNHYEDEVPDENSYKWDRFEENIKERFQYLGSVKRTRLYVNGDLISDSDPMEIFSYGQKTHNEVYEGDDTGEVHIAVKHSTGSLTVYSGGIKVCDVDSRGLQGRVVTEKNLRLNFARNEIKSGCPIWNEVRQHLDEIRQEMFTGIEENQLNDKARKFVADRMFNHDELDEYSDAEVFQTASEDVVSLDDLLSRDEVGMATKGNPAADKLAEAYGQIVLDKNDKPVEQFDEHRDDIDGAPDDFDAEPRAESHGLYTGYEDVDEATLTPTEQKKLGIARYIVHLLDEDVDVEWGKSDVANAWTDGESYVKISESAAPSSRWVQWVPELWRIMVHELAHESDTSKRDPSHGVGFNRRFRKKIDKQGGIEALSELMAEIDDRSLSEVAEIGHHKAL